MTKSKKVLWIINLCVIGVALLEGLASTVLLIVEGIDCDDIIPGIVAVFGLLCLGAALTMCILQRKHPKLAFGTMGTAFAAAAFLCVPIGIATRWYLVEDAYYAMVAGILSVGVATMALIGALLKGNANAVTSAPVPAPKKEKAAVAPSSGGMNKLKKILWIVLISVIGAALLLALVGTILLFVNDLYVESGIVSVMGMLCLIAALVMCFIQKNHPKLSFGTMGAAFAAAPLLIATIGIVFWYFEEYAIPSLLAGILSFGAAGLALVIPLLKGGKKEQAAVVIVNGERDWGKDKYYHEKIAHARQAFDDLKSFYEKGVISKEEYREERIFVLYSYGIGKDARFSDTFRGYEEKRWKSKKQEPVVEESEAAVPAEEPKQE